MICDVLSQSVLGLWPRRLSWAADGKKEWDAGGQCLDAAHKDDQTYGRENPLQDIQYKHSLCSLSSVRLRSSENSGLLASSQAPRVEVSSGFLRTIAPFNREKLKWEAWRGFPLVPTAGSKLGPPVEDKSVPRWKNAVKPDLFASLRKVRSGTLEQTSNTLLRGCCVQRLCTVTSQSCVSISI